MNDQPMYSNLMVIYDIGEARVRRICNYLKRYLPRVQNSVFEGELTEAKLETMKAGLRKRMELDYDAVLIWVLRDPRWADRQVIGKEKLPVSNFL